jgi:hypothetical protein
MTKRANTLQVLLFPVRVVVAVLVVLSEIARPLYRPFVRWISELSFVVHFSDLIASLPRGVILILFAIPFAVAEPLKILALVVMAKGHLVVGLVIIVIAYLMSFVLVERIFHAGREKLLTYRWMSWIMERVDVVRAWVADLKSSTVAGFHRWIRKAA